MKQVITIDPDGIISGLQRKPSKGLDLREFGDCEIKRVSEIMPTEDGQRWYVQILEGPYADHKLTYNLWDEFLPDAMPMDALLPTTGESILYFLDYDKAVQAEIDVLDAMRLQGKF